MGQRFGTLVEVLVDTGIERATECLSNALYCLCQYSSELPEHEKAYMNPHSCCLQILQSTHPRLLLMCVRCSVICLLRTIMSLWLWGWDTNGSRWWRAARIGEVVSTTWTRGVAEFISLVSNVVIGLNGWCMALLLLRRLWASLADRVLHGDIGPLLLASYFCHFGVFATRADTRIQSVCHITGVWA